MNQGCLKHGQKQMGRVPNSLAGAASSASTKGGNEAPTKNRRTKQPTLHFCFYHLLPLLNLLLYNYSHTPFANISPGIQIYIAAWIDQYTIWCNSTVEPRPGGDPLVINWWSWPQRNDENGVYTQCTWMLMWCILPNAMAPIWVDFLLHVITQPWGGCWLMNGVISYLGHPCYARSCCLAPLKSGSFDSTTMAMTKLAQLSATWRFQM